MSDPSKPTPPDPWWLKLLHDQHFKLFLTYLFKTSGVSSLAVVQKWFPGLTPDTMTTYAIYAFPVVISFGIDWWRNNPNNIIKRALLVLNGPSKVTEETKAEVTATVSNVVAGVKVKVDPVSASPAVVEMAKSQDNNVKMDKAA